MQITAMRHAVFGTGVDGKTLHIIPEHMVRFKLTEDPEGKTTIVAYLPNDMKGLPLPHGTQVVFVPLAAITPEGGVPITAKTSSIVQPEALKN